MWGPFVVFLLAAAGLFVWAMDRDRRRGRSVARAGAALGLRYERSASAVGARLDRLPSLDGPGRVIFSHLLESDDEIIVDWRLVARPKERRRHRVQTLYAFRRPELSVAPVRDSSTEADQAGSAPLVVEAAGDWVACHVPGSRTPGDAIPSERERMRSIAQGFEPPDGSGD